MKNQFTNAFKFLNLTTGNKNNIPHRDTLNPETEVNQRNNEREKAHYFNRTQRNKARY